MRKIRSRNILESRIKSKIRRMRVEKKINNLLLHTSKQYNLSITRTKLADRLWYNIDIIKWTKQLRFYMDQTWSLEEYNELIKRVLYKLENI